MQKNKKPISRRRLLEAAGVSAAAATAGCLGDGLGGGGNTATPELPSIEQQTIQKEKAGITHLLSTVSGTAVYPSFEYRVAGGGGSGGGGSIVGLWENETEKWQFNADRTFTVASDSQTLTGEYTTDGSTLTVYVQTEEGSSQVSYQYSISGSGSSSQLTLARQGEQFTYRLTGSGKNGGRGGGGGGGGGSGDFLENLQQLQLVPEQGASATREQQQLQTGASGSGFIVSPDGYIVTNAHVALSHRDPQQMLFQRLAAVTQQAAIQEMQSRYQMSEEDRQQAVQILSSKLINYYLENGNIQNVATDYNVLNGVAGPGEDVQVKSWPATLEKEGTVVKTVNGEPSWGRDVAVIKVNQSQLPTVEVGSSDGLTAGDKLFVIGYPGIQIESYFQDRNAALEPTLTTGVVSQTRTLNSGVNTIQTDAAINSGNSGGPMFDENGEVVGIATFGPSDEGIEQVGFGLEIEVAKNFLGQLNVENEQSQLDEAYEAALDAYWRGDCDTTQAKMDTVTNLYPDHPYANEYVRDCETGDAPGQDG